MNKTKHTPGPWTKVGSYVYGPEGDCDLIVDFESTEDEEMLANATLIAAAPELLESLQYMVVIFCEGNRDTEEAREIFVRATEVLAKAEGEQK